MPAKSHGPNRSALALITAVCLIARAAAANEPPSSQPGESDLPTFTAEKITVQTGKYELPGLLTLPIGDGPFPAVVLVHGSGPHDMDESIGPNKVFKDIAEGLANHGVAALRYEKRTHKYGATMNIAKITIDKEVVDDALSAVKLARGHARIDPKRVFVAGHSLGGTCAPLIGIRDKEIAGLILLSGTPRSLLDLINEQMEYIFNADGKLTKKEKEQLDEVRKTTQLIREGKYDEVKAPFLGAPAKYWGDLHKLDVLTPARQFGRPILIIGGGRDYQVTEKCFNAWKEGLKDSPNVTFKWYKRNNHLLIAGDEVSTPEEYMTRGHVSKKTIREIAAWIKSAG
jgi:hypothetical protein